MALQTWDRNWELNAEQCPCDIHFMDWVRKSGLKGGAIFHFGTGGHHLVGTECSQPDLDNAVYGITASPMEYDSYVRLVVDRPDVGRSYKTFFGDIYQLDKRMLPQFDAVTLFHLCEFRSEVNEAYGALTELAMAELLVDQIKPGGHVLFYTGSYGFEASLPVIEALLRSRGLELMDDHQTLRVYRKPARVAAAKAKPAAKAKRASAAARTKPAPAPKDTPAVAAKAAAKPAPVKPQTAKSGAAAKAKPAKAKAAAGKSAAGKSVTTKASAGKAAKVKANGAASHDAATTHHG